MFNSIAIKYNIVIKIVCNPFITKKINIFSSVHQILIFCIFYVSELVKYVIHALTQQSLEIANKILKNWNKNINISKICNLFLEFSEFSDIRDVLSVMISES